MPDTGSTPFSFDESTPQNFSRFFGGGADVAETSQQELAPQPFQFQDAPQSDFSRFFQNQPIERNPLEEMPDVPELTPQGRTFLTLTKSGYDPDHVGDLMTRGYTGDQITKSWQPTFGKSTADLNLDLVERAQKRLREYQAENPGKDWGRYLADRVIPGFSTGKQLGSAWHAKTAADKLDSNPLTETEALLLARYMNDLEDEQKRTGWKRAGDIVANVPAYVGELAATRGMGAVARKALHTALRKVAGRIISRNVAARVLARGAKAAAEIGARTQGIPQRIAKTAIERQMQYPSESWLQSLAHSEFQNLVEVGTEIVGGRAINRYMVKPLKGIAVQLAKKTGTYDPIKRALIDSWINLKAGRTLQQAFEKVAKPGGWDGMLGELGEERVNEILMGAAGSLGAKGQEYNYGATGQLAKGNWSEAYQQLWPEVVAFAAPGVTLKTAGGIAGYFGLGKSRQEKIDDYLAKPDSDRLYQFAVNAGMPPIPQGTTRNRENRVAHADFIKQAFEAAKRAAEEPQPVPEGVISSEQKGEVPAVREGELPVQGVLSAPPETQAVAGVEPAPAFDEDEAMRLFMQGFNEDAVEGTTPPAVAGAQEAPVSATASQPPTQEIQNATQEGQQPQGDQQQYPNGDRGGQTAEASGGNRDERGGQVAQEVAPAVATGGTEAVAAQAPQSVPVTASETPPSRQIPLSRVQARKANGGHGLFWIGSQNEVEEFAGQRFPDARSARQAAKVHNARLKEASTTAPSPPSSASAVSSPPAVVAPAAEAKPLPGQKSLPEPAEPRSTPKEPAGLTVETKTGRKIPAPPQIRLDSNRKATKDLKSQHQWLINQGIAEAKAKGDDYNLSWIERETAKNLPRASVDSLNEYLFGETNPEWEASGKRIKELSNAVPAQAAETQQKPAAKPRTESSEIGTSDATSQAVQRPNGPEIQAETSLEDRIAAWPDEAVRDAARLSLTELARSEAVAADQTKTKAERSEAEQRIKAIQAALDDVFVPTVPDEPTVRDRPSTASPKAPKSLSESAKAFLVEHQADIREAAENAAGKLGQYGNEPFIDDIVSNTTLNAGTGFASFDPKEFTPRQWLFGIAKNAAASLLRDAGTAAKYDMAAGLDRMTADEKAGVKPPAEGQKAVQDAIDLTKSLAKKHGKRLNTPGGEFLIDMGRLTKAWLKAGVLTFRDYVQKLAEHFDHDALTKNATLIEKAWQAAKSSKAFPGMTDSESVADVLNGNRNKRNAEQASAEPPKTAGKWVAVPSEGSTVGTKNAKMEETLARHGLEPLQAHDPETVDGWISEAAAKIKKDDQWIPGLLEELAADPRPITDVEELGLNLYGVSLDNKLTDASNRLAETAKSKDDVGNVEAKNDAKIWAKKLFDLSRVTKAVGTLWGKSGRARQTELKSDFTVGGITRRFVIANLGDVPDAKQSEQINEWAEKYAKAELTIKQLEESEAKLQQELAAEREHNAAVEKVTKRQRTSAPASAGKQRGQARVANGFKMLSQVRGKTYSIEVAATETAKALFEIAHGYAEIGVASFTDAMKRFAARIGADAESMRVEFKKQWDAAIAERGTPDFKSMVDPENKRTLGDVVRKIHQFVIERDGLGKTKEDREKAIDGIHEILKTIEPDITREQTARIMSGRDEPTRKLTQEEVRAEQRQQQQIVEHILDVKAGEPTNKMLETLPDTPEKRKLRRELADTKRKAAKARQEAGIPEPPPSERHLASVLETAKRTIRSRIEDLQDAIAKREPIQRTQEARVTDPELDKLRSERDVLQKAYGDAFGKHQLSDEQRLEILDKAWTKQIDQLERDIPKGILYPDKKTTSRPPLTPSMQVKKARLDALKAQRDEARLVSPQTVERSLAAKEKALANDIERVKSELEAAKLFPAEKPDKSTATTPNIEALQEQLDTLKAEQDYLRKNSPEWQARSDARYLATISRRAQYWAERLAAGDFSPRTKPAPRKLTAAQKTAIDEREAVKREVQQAEIALAKKNRHPVHKALMVLPNIIGFLKTGVLSGDLAIGRQFWLLAAMHPIASAKALPKHFTGSPLESKSIFPSQKEVTGSHAEIDLRPNAELYKLGKMDLLMTSGELPNRAETIGSDLASKIPGIGGSERANARSGNEQSANVFDVLANNLVQGGWWVGGDHSAMTPAEARIIGNLVNVARGRGNFGRFTTALDALSRSFLSPRWWLSRLQILTAQPFWHDSRMVGGEGASWRVRRLAAKETGKLAAALYAVYTVVGYTLSAMLGPPGPDKEWEIETDQNSSNYGQVRIKKRWFDLSSGLGQHVTFASRMLTQKTTNTKGISVPLSGPQRPFNSAHALEVLGRYAWGKADVGPKLAMQTLTGEDWQKKPLTLGGAVKETLEPVFIKDVRETMQDHGVPVGASMAFLEFAGINTKRDTRDPEQIKQSIALEAARELSTEDKTAAKRGKHKGQLKSEFDEGARDDLVIQSARDVLSQRAPTFQEQASLLLKGWVAKDGHLTPAYWKSAQRLPALDKHRNADGSLKPSGQKMVTDFGAWARLHQDEWSVDTTKSDAWNAAQHKSASDASKAGLPTPKPISGESGTRLRILDAIRRTESSGFNVPHFMGRQNEPLGDRASAMDIENLIKALTLQESSARKAGNATKAAAVAKERDYWQKDLLDNGMTAKEWKQQTGENDPVYPVKR